MDNQYAIMKTHLYRRIGILKARAERAEQALADLVDRHHRTVTVSRLHDPENQDWRECPCLTCAAAADVLRDITHVETST
jgi:hypothetical protein